ncbi:MAG: 3-isopropylmalate dehydrogenase [Nitrosomonadales bacterium]|nr:3-isopropylmalate dehydrogenase [Nitrosomonadales bacterium]
MSRKFTDALPAHTRAGGPACHVVGVFNGEGIGPEVVAIALDVLDALAQAGGRRFEIRMGGLIGTEAKQRHGNGLPDEAVAFCESIFTDGGALFCGAGGARFVYDLRAKFDLFCKFTPLQPCAPLRDTGALRPEKLDGVDIVAVRENTGGLYLGQWQRSMDEEGRAMASQQFCYRHDHVERILGVAGRLAALRRGRLCVVLKPEGVPTISELWQECLEELQQQVALDAVEVLEIDNAVYQLIADPQRFDVIVSPNMFGDVLADCGALLLGSRGMSYSGNFSMDGKGVYQTGHGAARDLAGKDCANPVGQLLSLAMMLEESFGWTQGAVALRDAIARTLAAGYRTTDIAASGCQIIGTRELGARIRDALRITVD